MPDYRGNQARDAQILSDFLRPVHQNIQQNKENELRQALQSQAEQAKLQQMAEEKRLAQEQQHENLDLAKQYIDENSGKGKRASIALSPGGGVNLGGGQQDDLLRALLAKSTIDDRDERKVERLQDDVTKSGVASAVESLGRAEKAVPGVMSGTAKFKSVGGVKNLVPNFAVPIAEKIHGATGGMVGMEPGSGDERAALQELQNAKIYDSSGKQINEAEMQRIKQAMGMQGMFDPSVVNQATKQVGDTVLRKNTQVTSGYPSRTVETFKGRGGLAGAKTLNDLLTKPRGYLQPAEPAPTGNDPQVQRYLELKQKYGR